VIVVKGAFADQLLAFALELDPPAAHTSTRSLARFTRSISAFSIRIAPPKAVKRYLIFLTCRQITSII
jgi:hypothetical protein